MQTRYLIVLYKIIDVELLIIEVEKYECLWNVKSKQFTDRHVKRKPWNDICKVLVKVYENLTVREVEERSKFNSYASNIL